MGQSKGGGYDQKATLNPEQLSALQQMIASGNQNTQQAAAGYAQFLPGGGGGQAITDQANKNFQQQTVPSILNAFSGAKGSSALNQTLASGASDLNSNLASMLSQYQLQAANGLGNLGQSQSQTGVGTPSFAYLQRQPPMWQQILQSALGATGEVAKGWASGGFANPFGSPSTPVKPLGG